MYNKEFNKLFEGIMYEIFQGILDKGITIEKLSNPNALAEMLDNLQSYYVTELIMKLKT